LPVVDAHPECPILLFDDKTLAPQALVIGPIIPPFQMEPIDTVLKLRVRLLELSRFGIPLVDPEEDLASPRDEIL
ncbi:hypothetical protein Tco_0283349, partial [Tanacetum coccineum]